MSVMACLFLVLSCVGCILKGVKADSDVAFLPEEDRVRDIITKRCSLNSKSRPVIDYGEVMSATISMTAMKFGGIEDHRQTMKVFGELDMDWMHPCAKWDRDPSLNKVSMFSSSAENFWYPELIHINDAESGGSFAQRSKDSVITFHSNGKVTWSYLQDFTSSCELDLKRFPFDKQVCRIVVEAWYNRKLMKFKLEGRGLYIHSTFTSKGDVWTEMDNCGNATVITVQYDSFGDKQFDRIVFTFAMARKPVLYILNMIVPAFCLMVIPIISGFIPPDNVDRVVCSVTVVLTFIVLLSIIDQSLPRSSQIPYMTVLLTFQLAMSLICTAYTIIISPFALSRKFQKYITSIDLRIGHIISFTPVRAVDMIFYSTMAIITLIFDITLLGLMESSFETSEFNLDAIKLT